MSSENIWNNKYSPFQSWKVLAWYERMLKIKTGNFAPPVNAALDVNQGSVNHKKCGKFNCNFCMSARDGRCQETEIPPKILFEIPKFFKEWGVKSSCIAGNNSDFSLYNHDVLIHFFKLCSENNIEIGAVTNGAYLSKKLMDTLIRTPKWTGFSINAGTPEAHEIITGTKTFDKIIENVKYMSYNIKKNNLKYKLGYKFLVTDDNYGEIIDGIKIASEIGINHFQIRPTDLPINRSKKIDVEIVEEQIKEGIKKYERPYDFEIFGIREKFKPDFTKKTPKRCIASPLGITMKADGDCVICPDRRWSAHLPNMSFCNFIKEGLDSVRKKWGGIEHKKMIEEANKHLGSCMRCTAFHFHDIFEHVVENDDMDVTLI